MSIQILTRSKKQNPIRVTHQEITAELGSSREVISRILGGFASEGMIRAVRGIVEILDVESLRARLVRYRCWLACSTFVFSRRCLVIR